MKTRRPISTISYNSDQFLISVLTDWLLDRKISWWCYINHVPDTDSGKNHKHIHIIPDTSFDTADLMHDLEELDPNNILPLKCMPFQFSKWDDWYLYCLHDKYYLKYKGLVRNHFYRPEDFICSDEDFLNDKIHSVDVSAYSGYNDLINAYFRGQSFSDLVISGKIPLHRITQFATVWKALEKDKYPRTIESIKTQNKEAL